MRTDSLFRRVSTSHLASAALVAALALTADRSIAQVAEMAVRLPDRAALHVQPGAPFVVILEQRDVKTPLNGYQAFLNYDEAALTIARAEYVCKHYQFELISPIVTGGGHIDCSALIDIFSGQPPVTIATPLARFDCIAGTLEGPTAVTFRPHHPPSRFSDAAGHEVETSFVEQAVVIVDATPPVFDHCPDDTFATADAGTDGAEIDLRASATDANGVHWLYTIESIPGSDVFDLPIANPHMYTIGTTRVQITARDPAGNTSTCAVDVTVAPPSLQPGDLDCSGRVDYGDIDGFLRALRSPEEYRLAHPDCVWITADCNGDGQVDYADINAFIELLEG